MSFGNQSRLLFTKPKYIIHQRSKSQVRAYILEVVSSAFRKRRESGENCKITKLWRRIFAYGVCWVKCFANTSTEICINAVSMGIRWSIVFFVYIVQSGSVMPLVKMLGEKWIREYIYMPNRRWILSVFGCLPFHGIAAGCYPLFASWSHIKI